MAESEDLEQSLRAEMDGYMRGRLSSHQEEIARLQSQVNEAFTRLTERLSEDGESDAPIAVAISEHLRRAFTQGTEASAQQSARARSTSDMALVKAAVDDIDNQRTQADILNTLVNRAASFTPRLAFFVIKNEHATGWRARGLEGTVGDDSIREISLPLSDHTLLSEAAAARSTWSGTPGSHADDHKLLNKFGGEPPQRIVAIPLVAREKVVAVLYADSAALEPDAINLEALETLVRVTGMAVELLANKRPAPSAPQPSASQPSAPPSFASRMDSTGTASSPGVATATEASAPQPAHDETGTPQEATDWSTTPIESPASEAQAESATAAAFDHDEDGVSAMPRSAHAPVETPDVQPAGSFPELSSQPGAVASPLGAVRRFGSRDAELPVEVSDEERRFHNDARRFARLLVSEIKLYNEQKVRDGRAQGDLYERLREEIDRSRQMYAKRVASQVATRYDYFHHELVNTLAEGDSAKLGNEYPGATA